MCEYAFQVSRPALLGVNIIRRCQESDVHQRHSVFADGELANDVMRIVCQVRATYDLAYS